jgi:hypothetical protein
VYHGIVRSYVSAGAQAADGNFQPRAARLHLPVGHPYTCPSKTLYPSCISVLHLRSRRDLQMPSKRKQKSRISPIYNLNCIIEDRRVNTTFVSVPRAGTVRELKRVVHQEAELDIRVLDLALWKVLQEFYTAFPVSH